MCSLVNSTKYLRKKLYQFSTISSEDRSRGLFPNSLYKDGITQRRQFKKRKL